MRATKARGRSRRAFSGPSSWPGRPAAQVLSWQWWSCAFLVLSRRCEISEGVGVGAGRRRPAPTPVVLPALLVGLARGGCDALALGEGVVDGGAVGDVVGHELGALVADVLELRDGDVLDADPRLRVDARLLGVDTAHHVEGDRRVGRGGFLVLRDVIGRGARARGNVAPADLLADELDVLLARGPLDELDRG